MATGSEITDNFPGLGPEDLSAVPQLLSRFVQEQRIANLSAVGERKATGEALNGVAGALADLSAQSIKVSAALSDMSKRIEHVEGAVAALTSNLRDATSDLGGRMGRLEKDSVGLTERIVRLEAASIVANPPPRIPGGLVAYVLVFALCFGAAAMFALVQWLVSLAH